MEKVWKTLTSGNIPEIGEKRIKPNVIRRRVIRPRIEETVSSLTRRRASIKIAARQEVAEETMKTDNTKHQKTMHGGRKAAKMSQGQYQGIMVKEEIWSVDGTQKRTITVFKVREEAKDDKEGI